VRGRLREKIVKGDDAIIFEGDPGRNLPAGDFAENAVHESIS
jgi:hypothetical protein